MSRIPLVMTDFDQYERRFAFAYGLMLVRIGKTKLSQEEFAEMVSKRAKKPVAQQNASGWLAGKMPRDHAMKVALAQTLYADPGWLYFGPRYSAAPAPAVPGDSPLPATASGAPSVYGSTAQGDAKAKREGLHHDRTTDRKRGAS